MKDRNQILPIHNLLKNELASPADIDKVLDLMNPQILLPQGIVFDEVENHALFGAIQSSTIEKVQILLDKCDELDTKLVTMVNMSKMDILQFLYREGATGGKKRFDIILYLQEHYASFFVEKESTVQDTLEWVRKLPSDFRVELFQHGTFVKTVLNNLFIKRKNLFLVMMDLYVQMVLLYIYSFEQTFIDSFRGQDSLIGTSLGILGSKLIFYVCILWLIMREVMQIIHNPLRDYISSPENWLDLAQLAFFSWIIYTDFFDHSGINPYWGIYQTPSLVVVTGIFWLKLLFNIGHLVYPVAVFMVALYEVSSPLNHRLHTKKKFVT
jgi:hypothetical protein